MEINSKNFFLVTGASSGIGRAIALALNASGASVIANGRDQTKLEETRAMGDFPERIFCERRDLAADMQSLPAWLRGLVKKYGLLDGLACSAGITWNSPLSYYPLEKIRLIFDICCHAPLILGGAFCGRNINSGSNCSIVYIAAAAAVDPNPGQGAYAAAKGALISGAKCLAREVACKRIRVNCISPGLIKSPMMSATCEELGPDFLKREEACYPLGLGEPEDVANLGAFLLSTRSRWITGQNFLIAGGR